MLGVGTNDGKQESQQVVGTESALQLSEYEKLSAYDRGQSNLRKLEAFKSIIEKLKDYPDKFATNTERSKFNSELLVLINEYDAVLYDPALAPPRITKEILKLYEERVERQYSGAIFDQMQATMGEMYSKMINQ